MTRGQDLRQQVDRPFDGPGNELREKRHIQSKINKPARGLHLVVRDVDGIAHGPERVERNPQGHDEFERRQMNGQMQEFQQRLEIEDKKVQVFEKTQDHQISGDAQDQVGLSEAGRAAVGYGQAAEISHGG